MLLTGSLLAHSRILFLTIFNSLVVACSPAEVLKPGMRSPTARAVVRPVSWNNAAEEV